MNSLGVILCALFAFALIVVGVSLVGCEPSGQEGFCDYCHERRPEIFRANCEECKKSHTYCHADHALIKNYSEQSGRFTVNYGFLVSCPPVIDAIQKAQPPALLPVKAEDLPPRGRTMTQGDWWSLIGLLVGAMFVGYIKGRADQKNSR